MLDSAVPADAVVKITKNDVEQKGDITYNEARTEVKFKGTADLQKGEYVITITKGDSKAEAKTTVEEKKVTEIKIKSKTALTGDSTGSTTTCDNKLAYIYYEVLDQYGGDMTASSDIKWTISSSKTENIDPSKGKITIKSTGDAFVYGTQIYIVGVYASTGATCNESVTIGMQQAIDKVEIAGFINDKVDKSKIETTLPKNFAKNTWYMVYETFDQNGMPMDTVEYNSKDITFISNNPLLLESDFGSDKKDADSKSIIVPGKKIYAVGEKQYAGVLVNPGDYADKGGEVTITAISNKTGHREEKNYVIGNNGLLKSLILGDPTGVVADTDINVDIPYTATDTDGNSIKNYETIVRSSNALSLSASTGTLKVYEKANGEAGISWSDDTETDLGFDDPRTYDNVERIVSLTTVVMGGESSNKMLYIKDRRRPVAFDSIKFGPDENDALVVDNSTTLDLLSEKVTYLDQYGKTMLGGPKPGVEEKVTALAFFKTAATKFNDDQYVLRVKTAENNGLSLWPDRIYGSNAKVDYKAIDNDNLEKNNTIGSVAVTYSIATVSATSGPAITGVTNKGKTKTITYNVVPKSAVKGNVAITTKASKYFAETSNTVNANGIKIDGSVDGFVKDVNGVTGAAIELKAGEYKEYIVKGTTKNGLTCTLPDTMYEEADDTEITTTTAMKDGLEIQVIDKVAEKSLRWNELYNENDARLLRVDAKKTLKLRIKGEGGSVFSKVITISDAGQVPATIKDLRTCSTPYRTEMIVGNGLFATHSFGYDKILDQYGMEISSDRVNIAYTVSDVVEKDSEFTHIPNSFEIIKNGTNELKLFGVEIGDTFKLTMTVSNPKNNNVSCSASINVTVGADEAAFISNSIKDGKSDETWRKLETKDGGLGMKR